MDTSLTKKTDYPLSRKISIEYRGKLTNLPDELGKTMHLDLMTQRIFATPIISFDYTTEVNLRANDNQVRSILSDYVPLTNYNHYIWLSQTYQIKGRYITTVNYNGVVSKDKASISPNITPPVKAIKP